MEYEDHSMAGDAGAEAGELLRGYLNANRDDPTCQYIETQISIAAIVGTDLAGLVTIGGLALLQNRIPGAAEMLKRTAIYGGSDVKA